MPGTTRPPQKTVQQKHIALQPLHHFPAATIAALQQEVARFYKATVTLLPEMAIPDAFITTVKTRRYRADSILQWLRRNRPAGIDHVAGLTTKDISATTYDEHGNVEQPESRYRDWGVFGLGYQPGPACVISLFRLQKGSPLQVRERIIKVVLHELGHNMGLPHCPNACLMRDAVEKLATVDAEPMNLCDNCRRLLGLHRNS